jgi:hypothetical protein
LRYTWYPPFFGPKQSPKIGDSRNWWQIASLSFWGLLCFLLCSQFPVKMFPKTNLWSQQTPRVACATWGSAWNVPRPLSAPAECAERWWMGPIFEGCDP